MFIRIISCCMYEGWLYKIILGYTTSTTNLARIIDEQTIPSSCWYVLMMPIFSHVPYFPQTIDSFLIELYLTFITGGCQWATRNKVFGLITIQLHLLASNNLSRNESIYIYIQARCFLFKKPFTSKVHVILFKVLVKISHVEATHASKRWCLTSPINFFFFFVGDFFLFSICIII